MKQRELMQLERLTFFSDAVFAIAITLLVLEIKVPVVAHGDGRALGAALLGLFPQYLGFIISFAVIGRFWVGHHRIMSHLQAVDDTLVQRNLALLFAIAFMPFPTAVFSDYTFTRAGAGFYAGWLLVAGMLNFWMLRHATTARHLLRPESDPEERARHTLARFFPMILGGGAFVLALWQPLAAVVFLALSPILMRLWDLWQRRAKRRLPNGPA